MKPIPLYRMCRSIVDLMEQIKENDPKSHAYFMDIYHKTFMLATLVKEMMATAKPESRSRLEAMHGVVSRTWVETLPQNRKFKIGDKVLMRSGGYPDPTVYEVVAIHRTEGKPEKIVVKHPQYGEMLPRIHAEFVRA